ncbi:MAG: DUF1501 domain-containing protein, partial [Planctomycetia bacterium]
MRASSPERSRARGHQRKNLDLLATLNAAHAADHPGHDELRARMESYELAYRMPMEVPRALDRSGPDARTRAA